MSLFLLTLCITLVQVDDQLISQLASDDESEASGAYVTLQERGVDAFPALISRLDDETNANYDAFQNPLLMSKTERGWVTYKPKVGDVAFLMIQRQIEGTWPKGFRHHYAITSATARSWLTKHEGLALEKLQLLATTKSLSTLAEEIAQDGLNETNRNCLEFLTARLAKVQGQITGTGKTAEDFANSNSKLVLKGGPEFVAFCKKEGTCKFSSSVLKKFKEILDKYPVADDKEFDHFAVVVRDGMIDSGLVAVGDPMRYQYLVGTMVEAFNLRLEKR